MPRGTNSAPFCSDNGDLSLRLRVKSARLTTQDSIFAIAEIRDKCLDLSPQLTHQMEFGHGSQPLLRKALLFFAASACVFFSQFNRQIPLLAPCLAVAGLWTRIAGACQLAKC